MHEEDWPDWDEFVGPFERNFTYEEYELADRYLRYPCMDAFDPSPVRPREFFAMREVRDLSVWARFLFDAIMKHQGVVLHP